MRSLFGAVLALYVLGPSPVHPDSWAFFQPTFALSPPARQTLDHGIPIVTILPSTGHEVGAFTAIAVDAGVTVDRAAAWMRRLELLRANKYVLATERFSNPARLADLERLELDDEDLEDIRRCSAGRCGVKFSAEEIRELRGVVEATGNDWKAAVQQAFRRTVLRRVQAYSAGGHQALADHWDHKHPTSPAAAFARVVGNMEFLASNASVLTKRLLFCPSPSLPNNEAFLYWSKERLGGKAVISVTHVVLTHGASATDPVLLMAGVQVFATHYLDASLSITAFIEDPRSARRYFVYVQKSEVDLLSGFWGQVARSLIEGRIRKDGPDLLRSVGTRLASGAPMSAREVQAAPRR